MSNSKNDKRNAVGYGKPPVATQFKPGKSGNPKGRPRGAKGRKATVKRILTEKRKIDPDGKGRAKKLNVLELTVLLLKQMAAAGDQRAYRAFKAFDAKYRPPTLDGRYGFLVVPEKLSEEEWVARYTPKDDPPGIDEVDD